MNVELVKKLIYKKFLAKRDKSLPKSVRYICNFVNINGHYDADIIFKEYSRNGHPDNKNSFGKFLIRNNVHNFKDCEKELTAMLKFMATIKLMKKINNKYKLEKYITKQDQNKIRIFLKLLK